MKAWACFDSTDINNNGKLSLYELKNLLWLYENEEPNNYRIEREYIEIDTDKSNEIDKGEWIDHLCASDK